MLLICVSLIRYAMEPVVTPLKLISRKFFKPLHAKPARNSHNSVRKKWLLPTISSNGSILPDYRPMANALYDLKRMEPAVKDLRSALKIKNYAAAEQLWKEVRDTSSGSAELSDKRMSWSQLASTSSQAGSYGPPSFINVLNDIVRHNRYAPDVVKMLVSPSQSVLDPFVLGYVMSKLGKWNIDLALNLLEAPGWADKTKSIGCTALIDAVDASPGILMRLVKENAIPDGYKLPPYLMARLAKQHANSVGEIHASVDAFRLLMGRNMLPVCSAMDHLLRKIYTTSEYGAVAVRDCSTSNSYPWQFYPFLVRRLCERITLGDKTARSQLDHVFDHGIAELASLKPSLVLQLLVMRIITTDGVQATSPVLNRWVESDPKGINEPTWLLLFQAFRRMGRPDKCNEVLARVLKTHGCLSLPFVGEYLMFTSQFHNLHEYLARLLRVIPEMQPVLQTLGIHDYVASLAAPSRELPLIESPPCELTKENRDFPVHRIHESWLNITYQAVLSTVEDTNMALLLFEKYIRYAAEFSKTPTSLRVTDQFISLICHLPEHDVDTAESVYRNALENLNLKTPADGKNHSKSLETLCFKLVEANKLDRAIQLLVDASTRYGLTIRKTTLDPWIHKIPEHVQRKLLHWVHDHAGVVNQ